MRFARSSRSPAAIEHIWLSDQAVYVRPRIGLLESIVITDALARLRLFIGHQKASTNFALKSRITLPRSSKNAQAFSRRVHARSGQWVSTPALPHRAPENSRALPEASWFAFAWAPLHDAYCTVRIYRFSLHWRWVRNTFKSSCFAAATALNERTYAVHCCRLAAWGFGFCPRHQCLRQGHRHTGPSGARLLPRPGAIYRSISSSRGFLTFFGGRLFGCSKARRLFPAHPTPIWQLYVAAFRIRQRMVGMQQWFTLAPWGMSKNFRHRASQCISGRAALRALKYIMFGDRYDYRPFGIEIYFLAPEARELVEYVWDRMCCRSGKSGIWSIQSRGRWPPIPCWLIEAHSHAASSAHSFYISCVPSDCILM